MVLVGPKDPLLAREIEAEIDGKVQMWDSRVDGSVDGSMDGEIRWEKERVLELIKSSTSDEIMIINEKKKLRAIPFQRS